MTMKLTQLKIRQKTLPNHKNKSKIQFSPIKIVYRDVSVENIA